MIRRAVSKREEAPEEAPAAYPAPMQKSYGGGDSYTSKYFNKESSIDNIPYLNPFRGVQVTRMYSEAYGGMPETRGPIARSTEYGHVPRHFIHADGGLKLPQNQHHNRGPIMTKNLWDSNESRINTAPNSYLDTRAGVLPDGSMPIGASGFDPTRMGGDPGVPQIPVNIEKLETEYLSDESLIKQLAFKSYQEGVANILHQLAYARGQKRFALEHLESGTYKGQPLSPQVRESFARMVQEATEREEEMQTRLENEALDEKAEQKNTEDRLEYLLAEERRKYEENNKTWFRKMKEKVRGAPGTGASMLSSGWEGLKQTFFDTVDDFWADNLDEQGDKGIIEIQDRLGSLLGDMGISGRWVEEAKEMTFQTSGDNVLFSMSEFMDAAERVGDTGGRSMEAFVDEKVKGYLETEGKMERQKAEWNRLDPTQQEVITLRQRLADTNLVQLFTTYQEQMATSGAVSAGITLTKGQIAELREQPELLFVHFLHTTRESQMARHQELIKEQKRIYAERIRSGNTTASPQSLNRINMIFNSIFMEQYLTEQLFALSEDIEGMQTPQIRTNFAVRKTSNDVMLDDLRDIMDMIPEAQLGVVYPYIGHRRDYTSPAPTLFPPLKVELAKYAVVSDSIHSATTSTKDQRETHAEKTRDEGGDVKEDYPTADPSTKPTAPPPPSPPPPPPPRVDDDDKDEDEGKSFFEKGIDWLADISSFRKTELKKSIPKEQLELLEELDPTSLEAQLRAKFAKSGGSNDPVDSDPDDEDEWE